MNVRCFHRHFCLTSQPLRSVPLPSPMEVHFWYVIPDEVKSNTLLNHYLEEILSPCEKKSVLSLKDDEIQKRALLARTLVRTTIARYQINAQVGLKSLKFKRNLHGKPEVEWPHGVDWTPPPLHFNLSHTSSLVACGITTNSQIGIDIEEKNRTMKHDVVSFARRFFCPSEAEDLAAICDPEKQRQEFIKLWTLKEAYVKALGRGFSGAPFRTFAVRYRDPLTISRIGISQDAYSEAGEIVVEPVDGAKNITSSWQFGHMELAGSHYAAICVEKENNLRGGTPISLKVWRTIPFSEDNYMSGTDSIAPLRALKCFTTSICPTVSGGGGLAIAGRINDIDRAKLNYKISLVYKYEIQRFSEFINYER